MITSYGFFVFNCGLMENHPGIVAAPGDLIACERNTIHEQPMGPFSKKRYLALGCVYV